MNALTTTTAAPIGAAAMIPRNMDQAMSLASMMAKAGFLAKELQTPGGALFVIEQAMRWNMSPFAVAMETSFIQGKPMFSGKIVAAAVTSSGALHGRLAYAYSGAGDDRQIEVSGLIRGEAEARTVTVRLRDARTANKVWQTQPDQQLAYHGSRVWARRHAPEVMLGVYAPEEMEEAAEPAPRSVPNLAQPEPEAPPPADMPQILKPDGGAAFVPPASWLRAVAKALAMMEDTGAVTAWRAAMGPHIAYVADRDMAMAMEANRLIEGRLAELAPPPDDAFPGDAP